MQMVEKFQLHFVKCWYSESHSQQLPKVERSAFKLDFLQFICKASLIFKSNLELALSIIFIQTTLSFVLSRKIIYNHITRKYGNVTVKDFGKHEKLEYKKNKLKLTFSTITNNLVCIRNSITLNCPMFLIKELNQFAKDSFVAPQQA